MEDISSYHEAQILIHKLHLPNFFSLCVNHISHIYFNVILVSCPKTQTMITLSFISQSTNYHVVAKWGPLIHSINQSVYQNIVLFESQLRNTL